MLSELQPTAPVDLLFADADRVVEQYVPMLRSQYRVTVSCSANAALQVLGRTAPAVVVMDQRALAAPAAAYLDHARSL